METAAQVLGIKQPSDTIEIAEVVANGLPIKSYSRVKKYTGFSHDFLAQILSLTPKTIQSKKGTAKLNHTASERLYKLTEVVTYGIEVFNSRELFFDWIHKPLLPLGGKKPIDLMNNSYGLDTVKNLLGRIQYGVYS